MRTTSGPSARLVLAALLVLAVARTAQCGTWDFIHRQLQERNSPASREAVAHMNTIINRDFHPLAVHLLKAEGELETFDEPWWRRCCLTALKSPALRELELKVLHAENELEVIEEQLEGIAQETRFNATAFSMLLAAELAHSLHDSWSRVSTSTAAHALNDLYQVPEIDLSGPAHAQLEGGKKSKAEGDAADGKQFHSEEEGEKELMWSSSITDIISDVVELLLNAIIWIVQWVCFFCFYVLASVWMVIRFFHKSWRVIGRYSPTRVEHLFIWIVLQIPVVLISLTVGGVLCIVILSILMRSSSVKEKSE